MNALRRGVCVILAAALSFAVPAHATSFSTDQSDLYYNASESGWGIQLVQRGSVIFGTLFIYGPTGQPTWYTATMDFSTGSTWTGNLIATTGTYFETPWNPAAITVSTVGTMTWTEQTINTGVLTYVVNGVTVVKNITRQTLVLDNFSGVFAGAIQETVTGCANEALNGPATLSGAWEINQLGASVSIATGFQNILNESTAAITCSYTGTLTQAGQMAAIAAVPFTCSDGSAGSISFSELQITQYAISGSFAATYSKPEGCQISAGFGGGRVVTY